MRFWGIHEGFYPGVQDRIDAFRRACTARGIEYIDADSLAWDYSNIPTLGNDDLLYALSSGAQTLTSLFLNTNVTTLYRSNPGLNLITSTVEWSILHDRMKLPAPRTIFAISTDRALLRSYVEGLGGFPIVLKTFMGSRGIGTVKIESWEGLFSTVDLLDAQGIRAILRQFINAEFGVRAFVLGDEILGSLLFRFQPDDFRNAAVSSLTCYEPYLLPAEDAILCKQAVHGINLDFAGVDLLVDRAGKSYLLEVNFPCGFKAMEDFGTPVAQAVVDYMIRKARHSASRTA